MGSDEQVPGIVSVAVLLVTAMLGPEFALAVGAYGVIMLGWFGGVLIGLWRMPPASRAHMAIFVAVSLVATLGVTVSATELLAGAMRAALPWASAVEAHGLLFPVAFVLPAIGHNWIDVGRWVWSLRSRIGAKNER
jgi:hypothetical protein